MSDGVGGRAERLASRFSQVQGAPEPDRRPPLLDANPQTPQAASVPPGVPARRGRSGGERWEDTHKRFTTHLPIAVVEDVRRVAAANEMSISAFVESALIRRIQELTRP